MAKDIKVLFGIDVDAVGGWLGSYGGEVPVGHPARHLRRRGGHAPPAEAVRQVRAQHQLVHPWPLGRDVPRSVQDGRRRGHEIGAHGYSHENPIAMTPTQEEDVLVKSIELIEKISGRKPRGYVAPWWEMSDVTADLLLKYGFTYDHSQGYRRFPAVLRPGRRHMDQDRLLQEGRGVDAAAEARQGDRPRRDRRQLVCRRPAADDVHEEGRRTATASSTRTTSRSCGATSSTGCTARWTMRCSPSPSTRCQRPAAGAADAGPLIEYINGHDSIEWVTMEGAADDFRARQPFQGGG